MIFSMQPKDIHPGLREQMLALYGKRKVQVPQVQVQRGSADCGCFAFAFYVSLLYGDDPATQVYNQNNMRDHIIIILLPSVYQVCISPLFR